MAIGSGRKFVDCALVECAAERGNAIERAGRVQNDWTIGRARISQISERVQHAFGVAGPIRRCELVDYPTIPCAASNGCAVERSLGGEGKSSSVWKMSITNLLKRIEGSLGPCAPLDRGRNQFVNAAAVTCRIAASIGRSVKRARLVADEFRNRHIPAATVRDKIVKSSKSPCASGDRWRRQFKNGSHPISSAGPGGAIQISGGIFDQRPLRPETGGLCKGVEQGFGGRIRQCTKCERRDEQGGL